MDSVPQRNSPRQLLSALAEFRFQLRNFLQFSENASEAVGLQPRQHQLLLQIAGAPEGTVTTIGYTAGRLGLRHNSAVELADRSERQGLLARDQDPSDRRRAVLRLTREGERLLSRLAGDHARELGELAPRLAETLRNISAHAAGHAAGAEPKTR